MKKMYYYGYRYDGINFSSLQAFESKAERDAKLQTGKDEALTKADIDSLLGRGKWIVDNAGMIGIKRIGER